MAFEIEQPGGLVPSPVVEPTKPRLLGLLGPSLIVVDTAGHVEELVRGRPTNLSASNPVQAVSVALTFVMRPSDPIVR
jgi:hypothetical protein